MRLHAAADADPAVLLDERVVARRTYARSVPGQHGRSGAVGGDRGGADGLRPSKRRPGDHGLPGTRVMRPLAGRHWHGLRGALR